MTNFKFLGENIDGTELIFKKGQRYYTVPVDVLTLTAKEDIPFASDDVQSFSLKNEADTNTNTAQNANEFYIEDMPYTHLLLLKNGNLSAKLKIETYPFMTQNLDEEELENYISSFADGYTAFRENSTGEVLTYTSAQKKLKSCLCYMPIFTDISGLAVAVIYPQENQYILEIYFLLKTREEENFQQNKKTFVHGLTEVIGDILHDLASPDNAILEAPIHIPPTDALDFSYLAEYLSDLSDGGLTVHTDHNGTVISKTEHQ